MPGIKARRDIGQGHDIGVKIQTRSGATGGGDSDVHDAEAECGSDGGEIIVRGRVSHVGADRV